MPDGNGELLSAIDDLGTTRITATLYRHTAPNRDPLSGAGARLFGGRWNPKGGPATIYLARPVESCIAEFLRMAEGQGRGAESFLPRDVHVIDVDLELIDLRTIHALEQVGLTATDLHADDWVPCQHVGAAIEVLGYTGLITTSATGVGDVAAIFERHIHPDLVSVQETRRLADYL